MVNYSSALRHASESPVSACCVDLETSSLNANWGVVLCAVIKEYRRPPIVLRRDEYKGWKDKRSNDKEIVSDLAEVLSQFDILIAYNGTGFDLPFLRTRQLRWGLPLIEEKTLIDPIKVARSKLRLGSNTLHSVANLVEVNTKTAVKPEMWVRASHDGDTVAMNEIVRHCVEDVKTLEKVTGKVKGLIKKLNTYGSGY